jgi:ubiquinone/menaquinone biosynthesis C-methylase UbiE
MTKRKPYKGIGMEGAIAIWYAKNTARDPHRFTDAVRLAAKRAQPGSEVLEVAPGPGFLAIELAKQGYRVTTLDISATFVKMAREYAAKAGVTIDVRQGSASQMPFADNTFDFVICTAAFKNFSDPVGALDEVHRVLRTQGAAVILDLRKEAARTDIEAEIGRMGLSAWNARLTRWIFRYFLLKRAYSREQLERLASQSRFGRCVLAQAGISSEMLLRKSTLWNADAAAP